MNTEKSEQKAAAFLKQGKTLKRKKLQAEKTFQFPPEQVFPQLCPTRELDWIDGWDCDLVYTSTGYAERDCLFTTPDTNVIGPGLWMVTGYEPDRRFEFVRIIGNSVAEHCVITLADNKDGTCVCAWNITFTALNESGNQIVEAISDNEPTLNRAMDGLEYFLKTGELMKA